MFTPILTTKLHFPVAWATIVPRPRLVSRLHAGLSHLLTIVSAPAGYGKTTLLGEWRSSSSGRDFPAAWLSLDDGDNDVQNFINYLVLALESAGTGIAGKTLLMLQAPTRPANELILTSLVDDLAGYPHDLAIILDDYHVIETAAVHAAVKFLMEYLPPQVHLILLTRADPPLPLARLRARRQMTEIRAADLRFSLDETSAFLNDTMGLSLSAGEVSALEARTEGWIAGLQLAALSMQGRGDIQNFINAFTGSHRYIVDYLIEEVLNRQPAHIHDFLLKTSILEQMNASLCDALIENNNVADNQSILEYLERANIFLTPLDDERRWYRYHHLFADVLRSRLQHSQAESLPGLYRRAIVWYEQNDLIDQAIQHALALKDFDYAAQLYHRHWLHLLQQGHVRAKLMAWLESMPESVIADNPRLGMGQVWMLLSSGCMPEAQKYLACVAKALETPSDDPDRASLPAEVLAFQAFQATNEQDFVRALDLARQAQSTVPESALFARGAIATALIHIHLEMGNFSEALQAAQQALSLIRIGGAPAGRVTVVDIIASIYNIYGQLHQAMDICREALQIAEAENQARYPQYGIIYQQMAFIFYEWNNLDQAERYIKIAIQMAEHSGDEQQVIGARLQLLQLHLAQSDFPSADSLLDELNPFFQKRRGVVTLVEADARFARWQAVSGRTDDARAWLAQIDLAIPSRMGLRQGAILMDAVRVMLFLDQANQALDLLQRMGPVIEHSAYWKIESLVLQSVAWHKKRETLRALSSLDQALELAEQGGFVRKFLDEAPAMIDLLQQAASREMYLLYTTRLLNAVSTKAIRPVPARIPTDLLEPLSVREQEVLQLIALGRLNKEIAGELIIAIGTVKHHTANIFRKLDVINRTQAVARSRELGLL